MRRASTTILELQVATPDGFKPITGNSVQETQHRIVEILSMDYPTFINSALLLQGRADEFTTKPPAERKRVLANILNLSLYDELEEEAKELAKQREMECANLGGELRGIDAELALKEGYQAEFHEVRSGLAKVEAQVRSQEAIPYQLRQDKRELELKGAQMADVKDRLSQAEAEISRLKSQLDLHQRRIEEYESVLRQSKSIEEGYQKLTAIRSEDEELNCKLMQHVAMTEHRNQLERAIAEAKGNLLAEKSVLQSQIQRLDSESARLPSLKEELEKTRAGLAQLYEQEAGLGQKRQQAEGLSNHIHHMRSVNAQLEEEIKEIKTKAGLLSHGDAHCPLCETELGDEGRERLIAKYGEEEGLKAQLYHTNEAEIELGEGEYHRLKNDLTQLEDRLNRERAIAQGQELALSRDITSAQEAASGLVRAQSQLEQVMTRLERADFAPEEQTALRELLLQIEGIGYGAERHRVVREHLAELSGLEDSKRRLDEAERLIRQERAQQAQVEEGLSRWGSIRDAESKKEEALAQELRALPQLAAELAEAEQAYNALLERQARGRELLGAVQQKLDRCASLERLRGERATALNNALSEESIYKELSLAFGKKGIQALIIEQALPELEDEANRLLSRMTDNKMSLRLESQRQTKKGETIETLDIRIHDELGTRNYEMFSGGEAFRIDFALRIALSKLLARRAGAPLPTLFIDEGFGTQDSSGRDRLVEAINSIQDDFEKIIVITHIEELRDAFPVRIEVIKTSDGSTFSIS
jgi:exonuclease SbcC